MECTVGRRFLSRFAGWNCSTPRGSRDERHEHGSTEEKGRGKALVVAQFDAGEAHDQKCGGSERADREAGGHLPEYSGLRHPHERDAEGSPSVREHWENTEVEGVRIEDQAELIFFR